MRINKYLADKGYATRRQADELIKRGLVFVNGKPAQLGDDVSDGDEVEVPEPQTRKEYLYYAYNKPVGVATEAIKINRALPVGRLDKSSHGLLILSNDRRLTDRLLSPHREHEKEYLVRTAKKLRPSFRVNMEKGVAIGDYVTKPCKVSIRGEAQFTIILTEGKKHQIRRMCEAMHNDVVDLQRVRVMNIKLGNLPENKSRRIEGREIEVFLKSLGL